MLYHWIRDQGDRFDAVHVHGLLNLVSSLAARTTMRAGRPLVICPFGTLSRYTVGYRRSWQKRLFFRLMEYPNLRRASAVHFTTAAERDEAQWHHLRLAERAFVIPPPWTGDVAASRTRSSPHGPQVLFLSRIHPVKGLETLIDAWPLVRAQLPEARLIVAGDGELSYVRSLRARAVHGEAGGAGIIFKGFVSGEDKAALWRESDVFVLPSQHENFGMVVLEALAWGLPAVVSREVQLVSFVERHRLGIVADREPRAVGEALVRVLRDASLRARVAATAPALVAAEFSPSIVGQQLRGMYEAVTTAA